MRPSALFARMDLGIGACRFLRMRATMKSCGSAMIALPLKYGIEFFL